MNGIKVWPHLTIVAVLVALIAGLGVAFWMKHEQTAAAQELPYEARIQRVDGDVAFSENLPDTTDANANERWVAATPNQPFSVGDRIYTREKSRASLAFSGRNFARLDPNTSLDVIALEDRRTQLALRNGSAIFDVGYLAPGELFEVGTPYGAVDFNEPGLYNVGFDDNGSVLISALSGVAQVVGLAGSGQISKGELLTLVGQTAAEVALSRLNGRDAGYLVDDYYRYQYPNYYDGRYYDNYDAYLSDPYYYDPYRRDVSYHYVNYAVPGINDLDYYGDWQNVDGYGYAWSPHVDSSWVPYQQGYWVNDYPYGLTWVSSEPWGYAPYHYGRWANAGGRWVWIPDSVNTTPLYSPALVAFLPFSDSNQIGWVPLGPGDVYAPHYYDNNWQPRYLTRANTIPERLVNLAIPEAVTVIPLDAFGRDIDRRSIRRIDRGALASVRPTLEPLSLTPLRNAAIHSAWGRGKIDLPPGIAKKLRDTPVFVGEAPRSRFGRDVAKAMRVERVPDQFRNQKFKVRDDRNGVARDGSAPAETDARRQAFEQVNRQRQQQIDALKGEAARGNRQAERQARQLEQQNRQAQQQQARQLEQQSRQAEQQRRNEARVQAEASRAQERAQRKAAQQPQGQRVANPAPRENKPRTERRVEQPRPQAQPRPQPRYQLPPRQEVQRPQPQSRKQEQPRPQQMQRQERPQRQQVERQQPQPRQQVQQQPRAQPQSQGAPKHERQQPAQPSGQGQGGGKGKGKKP